MPLVKTQFDGQTLAIELTLTYYSSKQCKGADELIFYKRKPRRFHV